MERNTNNVRMDDINPQFQEMEEDEDFDLMKINPQADPRNQLQNYNENMRSMSTRMIAKSLIPKVAVLKKALK